MTADAAAVGSGDVVVVGSINVDLVVALERLPVAGETVVGGTFARHHGGKGANQAVGAARLGASVAFVGAVGDDDFGAQALDALTAEDVDVSRVAVLPGRPTGVALIVVDRKGENQIAVASGANAALNGPMVRRALDPLGRTDDPLGRTHDPLGRTDDPPGVLSTGFELPDAAVVAAGRAARRAGMRLLLNPAPARPLRRDLLGLHPLIVANELEAAELTGRARSAEAAAVLVERTRAPAIVTLGPAGALVADGATITALPAPRVKAVDATGAGDTFMGALAAELARGMPLLAAARFAVVAASLSVTVAGAREGMPRRAAVAKLLR
jgi:ribokinase